MRFPWKRSAAWIAVTFAATVLVATVAWDRELRRVHAGWEGSHVDVVLEPGLGARSMLERLGRRGVLRSPWALLVLLSIRGGADSLHAGEYRFDRPSSPLEVLERLQKGDVLLYRVTVPEGLVMEQVAGLLGEAGFSTEAALLAAFRDPTPLGALDPDARDTEGYLFPETYTFPRDIGADQIRDAMIDRFRSTIGPGYTAEAAAVGLGLREAVILASMIERETGLHEEMGRVSRVFHNRLARGMKLQCDPTVLYALHREGIQVDRLLGNHLDWESPWNTYRVTGLPVGPIANPGRAALMAAVRPAEGDELYFVAAPGGGHRFSIDLDSHLKAVALWRDYVRSSR